MHRWSFMCDFKPNYCTLRVLKKNNSVISSPSCCSKPVSLSFFCGTREKKSGWTLGSQTTLDPFEFHCTPKNKGISQNIYLLVHKRKKDIQVWKQMRVNDDRIFILGVNYTFNCCQAIIQCKKQIQFESLIGQMTYGIISKRYERSCILLSKSLAIYT